ncbi:MAG TPA: sulfite exporter TauE/SafE family protein [Thermoleophilaceae bacterium]
MILAAAATLVGAVAQSATGFGFALIAGPALFAVLDPHEAVTLLAILGALLSVLVISDAGWTRVRWRAILPMLAAALPGLGLGLLALELLPKAGLQLGVGVAVLLAGLFQLRRQTPPPRESTGSVGLGSAGLAGVTSGALTTSLGVSGPPLVLWLEAEGLRPAELRASLSAGFLGMNVAGGALLLAVSGSRAAPGVGLVLPLLGLVAAGHVAGAIAFRRLPEHAFRTAVLGLVVAAGLASAAAGLAGLL